MKGKKAASEVKEASRLSKEEWREYTKTVWHIANTSDPEHPAVFPVEIPRRLIKLFSFVHETVLDPFAGTGVTAMAALSLDRQAICVDQNPNYIRLIRSRCARIQLSKFKPGLQVIRGDSRKLATLEDESVALVVTSPPYWDKAAYGSTRANLGAIANYADFLDQLQLAFAECFRVLQAGRKICVVTANVNQHTEHGLLTFPLAADFIGCLQSVGFVLVNEVIWSKDGTGGKWGSWGRQRPIFGSYPYPPNFLFKNVHEHIIIAAKPRETHVRGPKVRNYAQLIRPNGTSKRSATK